MYYIGILDGDGDVWGVRIPDFPGVHGGGATAEDAVADAVSALREVGAAMVAKGEELPPPRTLAEIVAGKDASLNAKQGESVVRLPLLLDA